MMNKTTRILCRRVSQRESRLSNSKFSPSLHTDSCYSSSFLTKLITWYDLVSTVRGQNDHGRNIFMTYIFRNKFPSTPCSLDSFMPFRPEFFSSFNFTTAQVVCVTATINHKFISFSAVQIYDLSYIHLHPSLLRVYLRTHKVTSSQMALQLSRQSTAPVSQRSWVRIPFRPDFFF